MEEQKDLLPPKPNRFDAILEGIKAGLEGPGGIVSALLKTPIERRRDDWMNEVGRMLIELSERVKGFSIENLVESDLFVTATLQAAQAAIRTHEVEKRVALRNAILNIALTPDLNETRTQVLLHLIDEMTDWHIRILDLFSSPKEFSERVNRPFPTTWYMGGRDQVLEFAYPELANRRDFYDPIVRDLHTKGLLAIDSLHSMMSSRGMIEPAITDWGAELIKLIREPKI